MLSYLKEHRKSTQRLFNDLIVIFNSPKAKTRTRQMRAMQNRNKEIKSTCGKHAHQHTAIR